MHPSLIPGALRDRLERRFDGPIPPQLLATGTERDHMIDHHRAMIRFSVPSSSRMLLCTFCAT